MPDAPRRLADFGDGAPRLLAWNPFNIRYAILKRDKCCRRCGYAPRRSEAYGIGLEVSHIRSKQFGGGDEPENLSLLCTPCHNAWHRAEKAGADFEEWCSQPPKRKPRNWLIRGRPYKQPPRQEAAE